MVGLVYVVVSLLMYLMVGLINVESRSLTLPTFCEERQSRKYLAGFAGIGTTGVSLMLMSICFCDIDVTTLPVKLYS